MAIANITNNILTDSGIATSSLVPYTGATTNVDLGTRDLTSRFIYLNGIGTTGGNLFLRKDVDPAFTLNYTTLYSTDNNIGFGSTDGTNTKKAIFSFGSLTNNTERTYTLPDLSGTLALLEGTQTFSGLKTFDAAISANYGIALLNGAIPPLTSIYYAALSGNSTGLSITYRTGGGTNYTNNLNFPANNNSYLFPSASGTLALTSDLGAYLPLTGGTLTGGLSGTTATFSGLGTFYQLTMTGATAGRIFYAQTGGVVSQSGNLNWDNTNEMLGVGTPNPTAVITAFSNNAATQFKAAGTAPAFTFSQSLTTSTYACVFGLATSANHFITGTAAGDMAIANQSATAGAIVFGTGTAEKMRMSAAGNFGIGTSSPSTKLDVNGIIKTNAYVNVNDGTSDIYLRSNADFGIGALPAIQVASNSPLQFATNNTLKMVITSGGNVGIGTSSPSVLLHALNSSGTAEFRLERGGVGDVGARWKRNGSDLGYISNADWIIAGASSTDFGVTAVNNLIFGTSATERMRITSGGNVGIGTSSPNGRLTIDNPAGGNRASLSFDIYENYARIQAYGNGTSSGAIALNPLGNNVGIGTSSPVSTLDARGVLSVGGAAGTYSVIQRSITPSGSQGIILTAGTAKTEAGGGITFADNANSGGTIWLSGNSSDIYGGGVYLIAYGQTADSNIITFATRSGAGTTTERMRITNNGHVWIGQTSTSDPVSLNISGIAFEGSLGSGKFSRSGNAALDVNRVTNDGELQRFYQDGIQEGSISVSGATVSYNSFLGSHWSQLQDGSKTEILKGTILEAIDEMCVWEDEQNDRLPKSKISDTIDSKNVYGVFLDWDNDWETSNDFYVAAVGLGYIRVNSSQNVSMGDLLQSNGDGTAKIQEDDIMRSSTIAKVVSTNKIETYEDGSYLIAATLHCG